MNIVIFKKMAIVTSILFVFLCSSCTTNNADEKSTVTRDVNHNIQEYLPMRVISEEAWAWTLYQSPNSYYLTVVCGGVGIFNRDLELTKDEIIEFEIKGIPYIKFLASQVRQAPHLYEKRHLRSFENMQSVKEAKKIWREEKKL